MTAPGPQLWQPSPAPIPPPPARRPRKLLLFGALSLVLVLVAGVVTWLAWPTPPPPNRAPFEQALANLGRAPGVRYTDTSITRQKRDITTTEFGDQFGVTGYAGLPEDDQRVLRVNEKIYTKLLNSTSPRLSKWRGENPADEYMYGDLIEEFPPPGELAATLATALAGQPELPEPDDPDLPAITVNGVPALRANTAEGTLYVSRDAPHRLLRIDPLGLLRDAGSPDADTQFPGVSQLPSAPPIETATQVIDVFPIDDAQADQMYATLAEDTRGLTEAVDAGISFSLSTGATFNCSAAGCSVRAAFTGTLTTDARTRITSGQVTARLTVSNVTIDGRPAGGCVSAPATVPVSGDSAAGELACDVPEAGPVFAAVSAEYQQRAQQQANATGGTVTLRFATRGEADIDALAVGQAEVDQLLDQQDRERRTRACPTPNSFAPGTLVLLADGSTRPIERITPGTRVRATDPNTGRTTTESVTELITGSGPKQLNELSISDGQHTGTLTATAGHPFWTPTQQAWLTARELRAGQSLAGLPNGPPVHVTDNRAHQARQTVHNLTVTGPHTYYVVVAGAPVLVHNGTATPSSGGALAVRDQVLAAPHSGAGPPDAASCASDKIDNFRSRYQVGKGKNIAVADYDINGMRGERVGVSGSHQYPNSAPMPASPRLNRGSADIARDADSEWKILEELASRFQPGATGRIHITTERPVCPSCGVVIDDFRKTYPGITVEAADLGRQ